MESESKKENHKILIELIRFFTGSVLGTFLFFVLGEIDANPESNQQIFNWIGTISGIGFMLSYIVGFIILERQEFRKINYKDIHIYIYALFLLGIEYVLLPMILN